MYIRALVGRLELAPAPALPPPPFPSPDISVAVSNSPLISILASCDMHSEKIGRRIGKGAGGGELHG